MRLPFTSLNAATAVGAGSSRDLEGSFTNHTMVVTATGNPTQVTVALEGSLDGSNWLAIGGGVNCVPPLAIGNSRTVRYVRANLTALVGGTSPTVTAIIASA